MRNNQCCLQCNACVYDNFSGIGRLISLVLEGTKTVVWSAKYKDQVGFS